MTNQCIERLFYLSDRLEQAGITAFYLLAIGLVLLIPIVRHMIARKKTSTGDIKMKTGKHSLRKRLFLVIGMPCVFIFSGLFPRPNAAEGKEAKAVELRFDGRPKIGEPYAFSMNSRQVRTYWMKLVGISNSPRRRETQEISADGELIFKSLDPLVVQFGVEGLSQIVDGVKTDYAPLAGMTAIIRSSGVELRDILLGEDDEDAVTSVLGNGSTVASCTKTTKEIREMLPGARRLIASMFSTPMDQPEDYLGKSRTVRPGEKWTASSKPVLAAIKANGLDFSENSVATTAIYYNASKTKGIPSQKVYLLAESANTPGYDFKLEVYFTFPDGGSDAPLQIERSATEVVDQAIPEGVPGFSGTVMNCVTHVESTVFMVRKTALKH